MMVIVRKKVAWPHKSILGGPSRQRVCYDQLSLPQFVQGFTRNILDETNRDFKEKKLVYLGKLMEDTTDFSWQNAKEAHAVLLCDMEQGSVTWNDTSRIDRMRRAHAQKHSVSRKENWGRYSDQVKKPWFCKLYQSRQCTHVRDHEQNGKLQKHICA